MTESSKRGFAAMDNEKQRQIASKGGQAAHEKGTAHKFTPDEARAAGRKGGQTVSQDREHMAEIGRKGGRSMSRMQTHSSAGEDGRNRASSSNGDVRERARETDRGTG